MSTRNARRQAKKNGGPPATKQAFTGVLPWKKARATLGRQLLKTAPAPDGTVRPMAVVHPKDPELALRIARGALARNDKEAFAKLPEAVRDYTFSGYLTLTGYVADLDGEILGNVQRGDSFILFQEDEFTIGQEIQIPPAPSKEG